MPVQMSWFCSVPVLLMMIVDAPGEDSFKLHSVDLELEAVEKQIHDLQVKQAQLRQWEAALESSRTDAHLSQAQCTKDMARPGFIHSGAGVPVILKKNIRAVVLHAGMNDIRLRQTEILKKDFRSLVEKVRATSPTTRIIVSGPLPTFRRGIESVLGSTVLMACTQAELEQQSSQTTSPEHYAPSDWVTQGKWVLGDGSDKERFKTLMKVTSRTVTSPGLASLGPHPGARSGVGARRRAPGGRVFACGTRLGTAQRNDIGPPSHRPTTRRKEHKGSVQCALGSSHGWGPQRPKPWTKNLAFGTWTVTSLGGKEPELVREVERYRLEIVGLTSTHSLGSGTQLLERGWSLFYSGVPYGQRRRAGVGLLIAPQLSRHVLEFSPVNKRVVSLHLQTGGRCLTVVSAYGPNSSVEYSTFLETLRGVLEGAPTGDSIVLLGDFNAHVGNNSDTWRGVIERNGPPDLNSSGVLLLDFCARLSLSMTNTMFKHKSALQYTW
ncbi:hypothetical protein QTP70_011945 [Hemibagrus guttatus]|uniref:Endonuclease/exonuclease/phosphatase domain-containing protein n=1 Tax=Hemibagrus guttatus TaxID=175788 RepID=A0AAE0R4P5_9TELE|nr:hypothetical protein QTP70_011945 [Hemibagrus guttatus]